MVDHFLSERMRRGEMGDSSVCIASTTTIPLKLSVDTHSGDMIVKNNVIAFLHSGTKKSQQGHGVRKEA